MPAAAESLSPERQLEALREENRRLRADQVRAQAPPGQSDDQGQQARFHAGQGRQKNRAMEPPPLRPRCAPGYRGGSPAQRRNSSPTFSQ